MMHPRALSHCRLLLMFFVPALLAAHGVTSAQQLPAPLCRLVVHEEQVELEDARLSVDVARSEFAAFEKIFGLIEALWENGATERMVYLQAKYDRDAARLALARADSILEGQAAVVEQYRVVCDTIAAGTTSERAARAIDAAYTGYRRSDCAAQVRAKEIAEVNLEFEREWLASVMDLRANQVATRPDVILAELDVEREEKRLADAERRAAACLKQFPQAAGEAVGR